MGSKNTHTQARELKNGKLKIIGENLVFRNVCVCKLFGRWSTKWCASARSIVCSLFSLARLFRATANSLSLSFSLNYGPTSSLLHLASVNFCCWCCCRKPRNYIVCLTNYLHCSRLNRLLLLLFFWFRLANVQISQRSVRW